jgi:hypothetical protein
VSVEGIQIPFEKVIAVLADNIGKVYWEANLSCAHTAKEIRMCHTRLGHKE